MGTKHLAGALPGAALLALIVSLSAWGQTPMVPDPWKKDGAEKIEPRRADTVYVPIILIAGDRSGMPFSTYLSALAAQDSVALDSHYVVRYAWLSIPTATTHMQHGDAVELYYTAESDTQQANLIGSEISVNVPGRLIMNRDSVEGIYGLIVNSKPTTTNGNGYMEGRRFVGVYVDLADVTAGQVDSVRFDSTIGVWIPRLDGGKNDSGFAKFAVYAANNIYTNDSLFVMDRVGIGTVTPEGQLEIKTASPTIYMDATGGQQHAIHFEFDDNPVWRIETQADSDLVIGRRVGVSDMITFDEDAQFIQFFAGDTSYQFPSDRGDSGQVLKTNASGVLSWADDNVSSGGSGSVDSAGIVATTTLWSPSNPWLLRPRFGLKIVSADSAGVDTAAIHVDTTAIYSKGSVDTALAARSLTSHSHAMSTLLSNLGTPTIYYDDSLGGTVAALPYPADYPYQVLGSVGSGAPFVFIYVDSNTIKQGGLGWGDLNTETKDSIRIGYSGGSTDSFYVAEAAATTTGWKQSGDTIFIDTTGGSGTSYNWLDSAKFYGYRRSANGDTVFLFTDNGDTCKFYDDGSGMVQDCGDGAVVMDSAAVLGNLYLIVGTDTAKITNAFIDSIRAGQFGGGGSGSVDSAGLVASTTLWSSSNPWLLRPRFGLDIVSGDSSGVDTAAIGVDTTNDLYSRGYLDTALAARLIASALFGRFDSTQVDSAQSGGTGDYKYGIKAADSAGVAGSINWSNVSSISIDSADIGTGVITGAHLKPAYHDTVGLGVTAYGWGNHADEGYIVGPADSSDIAVNAVTGWHLTTGLHDTVGHGQTAYGWGDHGAAGYEKYDDSASYQEVPKSVVNTKIVIGNVSDTATADSTAATQGYVKAQGYITGYNKIAVVVRDNAGDIVTDSLVGIKFVTGLGVVDPLADGNVVVTPAITSGVITDGTIDSVDIAANAIRGWHLKDGTVATGDLKTGARIDSAKYGYAVPTGRKLDADGAVYYNDTDKRLYYFDENGAEDAEYRIARADELDDSVTLKNVYRRLDHNYFDTTGMLDSIKVILADSTSGGAARAELADSAKTIDTTATGLTTYITNHGGVSLSTVGDFIDTTSKDTIQNAYVADTARHISALAGITVKGNIDLSGYVNQWNMRFNLDTANLQFRMPLSRLIIETGNDADSQTIHASALYRGTGWGVDTTKYWLFYTPYYGAATNENPCVVTANSPADTFKPPTGVTLPLFEPADDYIDINGDTQLAYDGYFSDASGFFTFEDSIGVVWRAYNQGDYSAPSPYKPDTVSLLVSLSGDGVNWTMPQEILCKEHRWKYSGSGDPRPAMGYFLLSPSIVPQSNGKYRMWVHEDCAYVTWSGTDTSTIATVDSLNRMMLWEAATIRGPWDTVGTTSLTPPNDMLGITAPAAADSLDLWHGCVTAFGPDQMIYIGNLHTLKGSGSPPEYGSTKVKRTRWRGAFNLMMALSDDGGLTWSRVSDPLFWPKGTGGYERDTITSPSWCDDFPHGAGDYQYRGSPIVVQKGERFTLGWFGTYMQTTKEKSIYYTEGVFNVPTYKTFWMEPIRVLGNSADTSAIGKVSLKSGYEGNTPYVFIDSNYHATDTLTDTITLIYPPMQYYGQLDTLIYSLKGNVSQSRIDAWVLIGPAEIGSNVDSQTAGVQDLGIVNSTANIRYNFTTDDTGTVLARRTRFLNPVDSALYFREGDFFQVRIYVRIAPGGTLKLQTFRFRGHELPNLVTGDLVGRRR